MATFKFDQDDFQNFILLYLFDLLNNNKNFLITNKSFDVIIKKMIERGFKSNLRVSYYEMDSKARQQYNIARNVLRGKGNQLVLYITYDKKKEIQKAKNPANLINKNTIKKTFNKIFNVVKKGA